MAARLTTYVVVGIVAATLIAGLIVGAQRDDNNGPVDLIVFNGRVYTADASGTMAEAVAVRGNQILRVGSNREINRLRRPQTIAVDAKGAAVLPGFNDAEVRFIDGGLGLDSIDLLGATTVEELQGRIRTWADANPDRPWIVGRGWSAQSFPDGVPTRQLLDAAVTDRPAHILSDDGRAVWVNTKALQLARITRRTPDPKNGAIARDARTGEPTGILKDGAIALVGRLVPRPTHDERARALRQAIEEANRAGITSVQDVTAGAQDYGLYEESRRAGDLNVRVYSSLPLDAAAAADAFSEIDALSSRYPDDPLFKVGGIRIAIDGPIESHAAAMLEPYADKSGAAGATALTPDDLNRMVRLLDAHGWQVTAEAFGDRAVRMALDAFQHAARSNPEPVHGRRHRVAGIAAVDVADLPRFSPLGVIAAMQPLQGSPYEGRIDAWVRELGLPRAARVWPAGSVTSTGARLVFGTGWPAAPLNPMIAIHTAVTRTTADGTPDDGWSPAEGISVKRAINALTSGPAYASFDEQRKGSIQAGMLADLVVLSDDIFDAPASRLAATSVAVTIFDGKIVYRRNAKSTN